MHVLLISLWKPRRGGIVTHVDNLMKNSRNEFTILTYEKFIDLPILRALSFIVYGFLKGIKMRFDLIHAHYAFPQGFLGVLLKKISKRPLVVTIHGSDITVLGKNPFTTLLVKFVLKNSDEVITVSDFLRRETIKLGMPEKKVKVIYGGIVGYLSGELHGAKRDSITFVGSLVKQKGVDVLIEAFRKVKSSRPDVKLMVVGEGKERKKLETQAGANDIYFLGFREDLSDVLEKSLALVLPSREEGFGLVLLEAMAAGVPVVATNAGGIPEIVENRVSGILVEKNNPDALADGILEILENEELRQRLVDAGREVVKKFSWEEMANEVDRVYKEVSST